MTAPGVPLLMTGGGAAGTSIVDTFDRADSATLGLASDLIHTWAPDTTPMNISTNTVRLSGATAATQYVESIEFGASDGAVFVEYQGNFGSGNAGVCFRLADASNYWRCVYDSGSLFLERRVSGSFTTVTFTGASLSAGDVLRVEFSGTSIECFINAASILSTTSSVFETNTKHGIAMSTRSGQTSSGFELNNFDFIPD